MARLIRTEKEVEGRYEEVWLVVEEDALEQWPAGARDDRRPPGDRGSTGCERARGEAIYTADLRLPGMLHTAVLRSPHAARARRAHRPRAGARAAGRARRDRARRDPAARRRLRLPGRRPSRPSAPTRYAQARAARRGDRRRMGGAASRCSTRTRPSRASQLVDDEPRVRERGDYEQGLAAGRRRRLEASSAPQVVLHNSMETHQAVVQWVGDSARGAHLDAVHLGHPRRGRRAARPAARQGARVCHFMGGGFGSKNGAGRLHVHRRRARASARAGPCAAR